MPFFSFRASCQLAAVAIVLLTAVGAIRAQAPVVNSHALIDFYDVPINDQQIGIVPDDGSVVQQAQSLSPPTQQQFAAPVQTAAVPDGSPSNETNKPLLGLEANVDFALRTGLMEGFLILNKDAAAFLEKQVPGVSTEPRAPFSAIPFCADAAWGQSGSKGSYWFPARQDMDTAISKIDPRLIANINVFKGPYSALYGPSLSFYDIDLLEAPRYSHLDPGTFQHNGMSVGEYETNGQQWHGRQAFWGGTSDWGYRVGYSRPNWNDYETGDGTKLPSSYNSGEVDVALGANLTTNSKIDFHYLRLDQKNLEIPGQYFDINA